MAKKAKPGAMTPAQRKQKERDEMEAAGLRRFEDKIPDTPEAVAAMKKLAAKLRGKIQ